MKNIVKLIVLIISFATISVNASAFSDIGDDEKLVTAVEKLVDMGIVDGYEDDTFAPDNEVTRAEFAKIAVEMTMLDAKTYSYGDSFSDVDSTHWSYDYINAASKCGIVNGMGDGTFMPNSTITYPQAAIMIVNMLGYNNYAQIKGGYPDGYFNLASELGIFKGTKAYGDGKVTRADMAIMLYNALDCKIVEYDRLDNDGQPIYKVNNTKTLEDSIFEMRDMTSRKGILNAVDFKSIYDSDNLVKGYLQLDGEKIAYDCVISPDLVGCYVEIFMNNESDYDLETVKVVRPVYNENKFLRIDGKDFERVSGDDFIYSDGARQKKVRLDNALFIYNGRKVPTYKDVDIDTDFGDIILIDNDADSRYEVIEIIEAVTMPVENVSSLKSFIRMKNGDKYLDLNIDTTCDDEEHSLRDISGSEITLRDIKKEDMLEVTRSDDNSYISVVLLNEVSEGTVEGMDALEGYTEIVIDGAIYDCICSTDNINMGENVRFILNTKNQIVDIFEAMNTEERFGVLLSVNEEAAKIISGKEATAELTDDDYTILNLANGEIMMYPLADIIKFNSEETSQKYIKEDAYSHFSCPVVIKYKLDNAGNLKAIRLVEPMENSKAGNKFFNDKMMTFGGNGNGAFRVNEKTLFVCLPRKEKPSRNDYYVSCDFNPNNTDGYYVQGYEYDEDEKAVKYVVYTSDMDATEGGFIADDAAVAVFDSVKHRITDDGDLVYEINYFVKGKMNTALYTDNEMVTASLSKLKQGDMFYFSKNMMNEIDKIEKVSRYNLITASGYFHAKENNDEEIFGKVSEINHEVLDDLKNTIVDEIKVKTGMLEKRFVMPLDDMPYIYLFDTAAREITPATADDLFAGDSDNASDVYIFTRRNEVKGIVIVV